VKTVFQPSSLGYGIEQYISPNSSLEIIATFGDYFFYKSEFDKITFDYNGFSVRSNLSYRYYFDESFLKAKASIGGFIEFRYDKTKRTGFVSGDFSILYYENLIRNNEILNELICYKFSFGLQAGLLWEFDNSWNIGLNAGLGFAPPALYRFHENYIGLWGFHPSKPFFHPYKEGQKGPNENGSYSNHFTPLVQLSLGYKIHNEGKAMMFSRNSPLNRPHKSSANLVRLVYPTCFTNK